MSLLILDGLLSLRLERSPEFLGTEAVLDQKEERCSQQVLKSRYGSSFFLTGEAACKFTCIEVCVSVCVDGVLRVRGRESHGLPPIDHKSGLQCSLGQCWAGAPS